jgi:ribosomal protein S14
MDKRNRCSHAGLQGPYGIRTRPVSRSPFRDLSSGGQIPTSGAEREKQKPAVCGGFL